MPFQAPIQWPAILQLTGEAELTYFADEVAWQEFLRQPVQLHPQDRLIDSDGAVFSPVAIDLPCPTGTHITLAELQEAVRAHAAQHGQCCVAKLAAPSLTEAIRLVEGLNRL